MTASTAGSPGLPTIRCVRKLVVAVTLAVLLAAAGCNGDGDGDGNPGAGGALDGGTGASTTDDPAAFERRNAVAQINVAATGMNLVATEVGIRTYSVTAVDYCRNTAPGELAPHRAKLEAAADATTRDQARTALARLDEAIKACAGGADQPTVQEALNRYREAFGPLRTTIDGLIAAG